MLFKTVAHDRIFSVFPLLPTAPSLTPGLVGSLDLTSGPIVLEQFITGGASLFGKFCLLNLTYARGGDTIFCLAKTAASPGQIGMGVLWMILRWGTERFSANRRGCGAIELRTIPLIAKWSNLIGLELSPRSSGAYNLFP